MRVLDCASFGISSWKEETKQEDKKNLVDMYKHLDLYCNTTQNHRKHRFYF